MKITVLPFASVKAAVNFASKEMSIDSGASLGTIISILENEYPALAAMRSSLLFAINTAYANEDRLLQDGDSIAIFPPVSGG